MGHSIVVFIERWSHYKGYNHFGTCPSGLYRKVVIIKDCLIRQVSLYHNNHNLLHTPECNVTVDRPGIVILIKNTIL